MFIMKNNFKKNISILFIISLFFIMSFNFANSLISEPYNFYDGFDGTEVNRTAWVGGNYKVADSYLYTTASGGGGDITNNLSIYDLNDYTVTVHQRKKLGATGSPEYTFYLGNVEIQGYGSSLYLRLNGTAIYGSSYGYSNNVFVVEKNGTNVSFYDNGILLKNFVLSENLTFLTFSGDWDTASDYMSVSGVSYLSCIENWVSSYGSCSESDERLKTYNDLNSCNTSEYLPIDNGTYVSCNYCSEDLVLNSSECVFNGTAFYSYQEYYDNNYYSCCAITNLESDCGILYSPYNESGEGFCDGYRTDFQIEYDDDALYDLNPNDKVYWKIFINDSNSSSDYNCITYVKNFKNGTIGSSIQINPPKTEKQDRVFSLNSDYDDRDYFHTSNNLGVVYFTRKNLVFDGRKYLFGVECVNDDNRLLSERLVYPNYESLNSPITLFNWAKNNTMSLLLGFFILVFLGIFIPILYKKMG